jgi:formylglycine-generating enzyme required for sulfatase activity
VTGLSWYGAVTLCDLLSLSQGLEPYYQVFSYDPSRNDDSSGYRLPTPEQWYHAASNGDGTTRYAGSNDAHVVGVFYPESLSRVGGKIPNGLGIFDLSGNVREFCDDHDFAYLSGVELISNPTIPVRGGSFSTLPNHQTIERHDFVKPTHTFDDIGVRPVKPSV